MGALVLGTLAATVPAVAQAPTVPSGFSTTLVAGVPSGTGNSASEILNPTAMQFAPDGRLFICQQAGALRVVKNGALLGAAFMTLSVNSAGERGLLGIAFDPNFATNNHLYVYYTVASAPLRNRVSRFTANGDVVVAGSEFVLMDLDNLSGATNHNGGALHFGPDGKLYVAVGDNANSANAQSMTTRHGKILRLERDGSAPTNNPFISTTTGVYRSIWAKGLRNPFTIQFQPGSSRLYINDVGADTFEEINNGVAGANYGWPDTEGEFNPSTFPGYTNPLLAYAHGSGATLGCAITGGAFYPTGSINFPASYEGLYFYADYCSGWIRTYNRIADTSAAFATGLRDAVDLKVGPDGGLYVLQRGNGADTGNVYRIDYAPNVAPEITQDPQDTLVTVGGDATFSVSATGATPLGYQWSRDGVNINGATSSTYTLTNAQLSASGDTFACHVSNAQGSVDSASATLTVTTDQPPAATIVTPASGTLYSGGGTISYSGTGTDPEDGTEPASRFTWEVVFHHDTHTHPFVQPFSGATSGSFAIPTSGETSANVFYRIHLTVEDSVGLTHHVTRDVQPRKANLTLTTDPAGLQVRLDGQPYVAPVTAQSVVGIVRTIGVSTPQTAGGITYNFASWSDGGAVSHNISTPASNTTYTATFRPVAPASLTLGATTVNAGQPIQVTVQDGPGNPRDWVGMHAVSAADTAWLDWKYMNGTRTVPATGLTSAVLTFTAPSTAGTYNFRFFRDNTYTKLATSATFTVTGSSTPTLTLSTTSATAGQAIQVTVANGPGNPRDWVGLHAVSAADMAWLDWKYLSGTRTPPATGQTSAVLTFTAPSTPGTYNFRFFRNDTFTKLATSATLTVSGSSSPTLTLSTTTASPGQAVQVTVANGPGNARDWVGLHAVSAADTAWLDWKYLSGTRTPPATGMTSAVLTFTAPSTPGTYNFRFFQNDTFARLATSATLTVSGSSTPTLSVSTTVASPGQMVQVTVTNGPGNRTDWLGLHATGAADTAWLDWKYLSGSRTAPVMGLTGATVSFAMPQTPGTYEFRFFENGGFTRLATSPTVTVQ